MNSAAAEKSAVAPSPYRAIAKFGLPLLVIAIGVVTGLREPHFLSLANAQMGAGEVNAGLESYARLAQLQPQNTAVLLRVGALQLASKNYAAAIEMARKAIAVQPDLPQAWGLLARAQALSGQGDAAIAEARKMQKEQPNKALGYALEGEVLTIQKKWPEAAATLRLGLGKQALPGLAVATYGALQNAGKSSDAAAFAADWIRSHPTDTTMLEMQAQQAQMQKDYPAAIAKYRAVLEVNPEHAVSLNNLAWLLGEAGDPKALEFAERAYRQAPFNASVVDTLGWTLVKTGEVDRGTQLLRLASNLAPGDNEIRLHLGTALIKSGDKEGGRRTLEPLTKLAEGTPVRVEAEKAMATK